MDWNEDESKNLVQAATNAVSVGTYCKENEEHEVGTRSRKQTQAVSSKQGSTQRIFQKSLGYR